MPNKHFAVNLCIVNGEVEKSSLHVVDAQNELDATRLALLAECHSDADFGVEWEDENSLSDKFGEYYYSMKSCVEISPEHAAVLRTYL